MTVQLLREFLGWCTVFNLVLLIWWLVFIIFAHDWTYQMHRKWFDLSRESFDAIHYAGMAYFKLTVIVLNLVPYLVLRLMA